MTPQHTPALTLRAHESLPAWQIAATVNEQLGRHPNLVVTAPPGAGKSTLLPLTILQAFGSEGKILMLEPRRLAARQIAERMAYMLGEEAGQTVGYRVRFENRVSSLTRIEVLTEGILTRMLAADPTLEGVSVVIFDEFHERSLASDTALALTREAQQIIRPDLRIVIMSATIDTSSLCTALQASRVESQGRMYPVEVIHSSVDTPCQTTQEIAEAVAHQIREAHRAHPGDILAFLPGEAEIRRCQELLQGAFPAAGTPGQDASSTITHIFPLYGLLSPQEQRLAIAPSRPNERKVVLATSIAETSITIEGVRTVIDSGLCRTLVFDRQTGLSHLTTIRISHDMANQRSGRAGRVSSGTCYRLWSLATHHRMAECRTPEIMDADLSAMVLDVAVWGEGEVESLPWLTPPPTAHVVQAKTLLQLLDATDAQHRITPHGRRLAALPCHPRIAQMLVAAQTPGLRSLAADIAALLDEKDPLASDPSAGVDVNLRLALLRRHRLQHRHDGAWNRIIRIADQYRALIRASADNSEPDPSDAGMLIASAYPERVAHLVNSGSGTYRLANGEQGMLSISDPLTSHEWIAVANISTQKGRDGRIFLASPVSPESLGSLIRSREVITWDSKRGSVLAQCERRIGNLLVATQPLANASRQAIHQAICQAAVKEGTSMLDFNDTVQNLQRRVAAVSQWHPELQLPDLSTESVLPDAPAWLPFYLERATTTSELKKIDLSVALWNLLTYDQQQAVDRLAPTHIQVPTGSRIRVEYRQGAELPILRVRLQECFGLTDTPRVDGGQRPILIELLSPGFKPVQLTQDLRSFWQTTYFEVRKELRRRYPKHAWPDNPLEAEAVRGCAKKHP